MKKILVTGGAGYIGSHVCIELIKSGYDLIIIDNLCNSSIDSIEGIKKITGHRPVFYENDLRNKAFLLDVFNEHQIESVVHLAGLKSVGASVENPILYYDNNLISVISLLEVMIQVGCKSIVFSSSATVYGKTDFMPINESAPLDAMNPYGRSKLVIENILHDLYCSDNEWKISILRYFNPAGAHKSGIIGEFPKGVPNNLFPVISRVASGELKKVIIFGKDYDTHDGTGIRDYIHVVDLAKGHCKALEFMQNYKKMIVVNLGTGNGFSVLDVIREFEKVSNRIIPYEFSQRRDGDVSKCYADPSLSRKLLKWEARLDLTEMCKDAWNWEKNNF